MRPTAAPCRRQSSWKTRSPNSPRTAARARCPPRRSTSPWAPMDSTITGLDANQNVALDLPAAAERAGKAHHVGHAERRRPEWTADRHLRRRRALPRTEDRRPWRAAALRADGSIAAAHRPDAAGSGRRADGRLPRQRAHRRRRNGRRRAACGPSGRPGQLRPEPVARRSRPAALAQRWPRAGLCADDQLHHRHEEAARRNRRAELGPARAHGSRRRVARPLRPRAAAPRRTPRRCRRCSRRISR